MKIITFNIKAGGVGKTTLGVQTAFTLASKGKRVLVLGTDTSMNMTKRMIGYYARKNGLNKDQLLSEIKPENTVERIFQGLPYSPIKITDNIDLLAETKSLYDLKDIGDASMLHWWWDNEEYLESHYDYIIIDTHNDDSVFTRAAYAVSDLVTVIVDKTDKTFDMVGEMREMLTNIKNGNRDRNGTFVTAEIVVLGNRLDNSTLGKAMRIRLDKLTLKYPDMFVGYIEERTCVAKAEAMYLPLIEYRKQEKLDASLERFYRNTERTLLKLAKM